MIETDRLTLRPWLDSDLDDLTAINADPAVYEWLAGPFTREMNAASITRQQAFQTEYGYCYWAMLERVSGRLIGMAGLMPVTFDAGFLPAVEIGWRLSPGFQGRGYATEAAKAALAHGFSRAGLREIVSFTVPHNRASRAVMERIGMRHDPAMDFDHPRLPPGHPLRRHVFYRIQPGQG
ncbi:GNAT family N-acetyltransferase [Niveispirillum sp. BGYR6]|uniref:GNAT family N-acetyltransferase n=1 Tax=Niveispirillum sp. BGYR6 TaxID=2971249 RepID=UPI0022B95800|nr:GNAT family N-acetyltransferase [Niveispirillum sp. BGYR6]MDG5493719.1 GNAT family N-acetyltransferase [Niveispirillum sp. BGYR6]